ncbi:MAG: GYF domain-containing protein [Tepidisphaerales bacterium]
MGSLDELAAAAAKAWQTTPNEGEWLVYDNGKQTGPYSADTVRKMLNGGSLSADAAVWQEGMADWVSATSIFSTQPQPAILSYAARKVPHPIGWPKLSGYLAHLPRAGVGCLVLAAIATMMPFVSIFGADIRPITFLPGKIVAPAALAVAGFAGWAVSQRRRSAITVAFVAATWSTMMLCWALWIFWEIVGGQGDNPAETMLAAAAVSPGIGLYVAMLAGVSGVVAFSVFIVKAYQQSNRSPKSAVLGMYVVGIVLSIVLGWALQETTKSYYGIPPKPPYGVQPKPPAPIFSVPPRRQR